MTYWLCDSWEPEDGFSEPCRTFEVVEQTFTGPDFDYLEYVELRCQRHPHGTLSNFDTSDDYYDGLADTWAHMGYTSCEYCGDRWLDMDDHLTTHRACATALNDRWNSWTQYIGPEIHHADRWRAILALHDIEPNPAFEQHVAGFDGVQPDPEPTTGLDALSQQTLTVHVAALTPGTWRSADGTIHQVSGMSGDHLRNVVNYLARAGVQAPAWIRDEAIRRGIIVIEQPPQPVITIREVWLAT